MDETNIYKGYIRNYYFKYNFRLRTISMKLHKATKIKQGNTFTL